MLIVEFRLHHPVLERTLTSVPGVRLDWEQSNQTPDRGVRTLLWAEADDFEALERALDEDTTVTNVAPVADTGTRRLYRMDWHGDGLERSTWPVLVEEATIVQRITGTKDGWVFRVAFPDRAAFGRYREFCDDHDIDYEVFRIYEERYGPDATPDFGLSEKQHHILSLATERGYFDVPRKVELATLADEVGISHQAASERIRRAQATLNRNALRPSAGDG
ncbi:helix-turn-helix domain-containing protein [Halomarina litorea]|uniref:helix-turn-helix domain-containing protein n=1 Tax=Halomarina litorea TaxID=2961595 RepID=UPI0020C3250D|nr:helix-turn-helix domain-containing protein [Halomarina sp. BCD28]